MLIGNRSYGPGDLSSWCPEWNWDHRLHLKDHLTVFDGPDKTTTGACSIEKIFSLEDDELTGKLARTH